MKKILLFFLCILTMPIMLDASSMNGGDLPLPLLQKGATLTIDPSGEYEGIDNPWYDYLQDD